MFCNQKNFLTTLTLIFFNKIKRNEEESFQYIVGKPPKVFNYFIMFKIQNNIVAEVVSRIARGKIRMEEIITKY